VGESPRVHRKRRGSERRIQQLDEEVAALKAAAGAAIVEGAVTAPSGPSAEETVADTPSDTEVSPDPETGATITRQAGGTSPAAEAPTNPPARDATRTDTETPTTDKEDVEATAPTAPVAVDELAVEEPASEAEPAPAPAPSWKHPTTTALPNPSRPPAPTNASAVGCPKDEGRPPGKRGTA
jgi:hypothetical protein